jgi:hypothetical protein
MRQQFGFDSLLQILHFIQELLTTFSNFKFLFYFLLTSGGLNEVEGVGEEIVGLVTVQELEGLADGGDLLSAGLLPLVELLVGLLALLLQVSEKLLVSGEGSCGGLMWINMIRVANFLRIEHDGRIHSAVLHIHAVGMKFRTITPMQLIFLRLDTFTIDIRVPSGPISHPVSSRSTLS